jgi:hypothetical protein
MPNLPDQTWKDDCTSNYNVMRLFTHYHASFQYQVGRLDSEVPAAIRLSGDHILEEHCYFENTDGRVVIICMPESVTVRQLFHSCGSITYEYTLVFKRKADSARAGNLCFK